MGFTSEKQIPIVLIHHYRKQSGKNVGSAATLDDLSGSMKIVDGADRIINISRNRDPEAPYPEKFKSRIYLQKGREYPDALRDIFFIQGSFVDEAPPDPLKGMSHKDFLEKSADELATAIALEKQHEEDIAQANLFGIKD
jgi:hypothetical protein